MKILSPRPFASLVFATLAFAGSTYAATPSRFDAVEKARAAGKPVVEKGMTAEEIVRLIGKPADVAPMAAPVGKAERWTYRRVADQRVIQAANTVRVIPAFVGFTRSGPTIANVSVPDYRFTRVVTYQVTSLLMFEGRLVSAAQKLEQDTSFVD